MLRLAALSVVAAAVALAAGASAGTPTLRFSVAADVHVLLTDVVWTGTRFLYVENTANRVWAGDRDGRNITLFAQVPPVAEEMRCVAGAGRYGFRPGIYCHTPDNHVYRIASDGTVSLFATLPDTSVSDGALALDDVGRFGHALVAATGKSTSDGGSVFTIDKTGFVRKVGTYAGPGGADNVVVAPASFGSAAGQALLAVDDTPDHGSVVAIAPDGTTRTLAELPDGPNPIAVVPKRLRRSGTPAAGLYLVDTYPGHVLRVAAADFAGRAGDIVVGGEIHATFWLLAPAGSGFRVTQVKTNLPPATYNLEGATFVQ